MKKTYLIIGVFLLFILSSNLSLVRVSAHRSGCHRWHSCPSDTGSYVCGDLGYTSECPTSNTSYPSTPTVSTKNITTNEEIPYKEDVKYVYDEYTGFTKIVQNGLNGSAEIITPITYTGNTETSRGTPQKTIKVSPINKVTIVGGRIKPEATVQSVNKTKKKDKYEISGTYKPNAEVVLSLNNKKIKRAKTDNAGKFTFKEIKIKKNDGEIKIYKREKRKESQVSELTYFNLNANTLITEYQKLHKT